MIKRMDVQKRFSRGGLNNSLWLFIGATSAVMTRQEKGKMFPINQHMPVGQRAAGRVWIRKEP